MGTFHLSLMQYSTWGHMKINNTPQSPKPAFDQGLSTRGKAEFGATLTFHNACVQVTSCNQQSCAK